MECMYTSLLLFLLVQGFISKSDSTDTNKDLNDTQLSGQGLIDLGIKLHKPLLKLLGQTMRRVENRMLKNQVGTNDVIAEMCRLHPCSEWSEWSNCDAIYQDEFGGQTRSRTCGLNTTYCKHNSEPTNVIDKRLCEGVCPKDYTVTSHGFCLNFYDKERLARDDAEQICQRDGGHLVNVDSEMKVKDVNETILQKNFSYKRIWIDGRKSVQGDPWTYGYKSSDPSFTFWGDDDPDNGSTDLCINYFYTSSTNNLWRWFDCSCNEKTAFICQIQIE